MLKRFSLPVLFLVSFLFLSNVYVASAAPAMTMSINQSFISPNSDGYRDATIVNFTSNENTKVTVRIRTNSGRIVATIIRNWDRFPGVHGFVWGGTYGLTQGGFLRDGDYVMEISAQNASGLATIKQPITILRNSLSRSNIENGLITSEKLAYGAVGEEQLDGNLLYNVKHKIANDRGQVDNKDVKKGALSANRIAGYAWTAANDGAGSGLNADQVDGKHYSDLAAAFVNDNANEVDSADIATGAVKSAEIDANAVEAAEIADNAVEAAEIADNAVEAAEIAANAVGSSEIAANAVGSSEIADNAVGSSEITAGAVTQDEAPFALAGDDNNLRIERDTIGPLATDGATTSTVVSFGTPFSSPPSVYLTLKDVNDPTSALYVAANNVTTAGFDALLSVVTPGGASSTTEISWIAIGN